MGAATQWLRRARMTPSARIALRSTSMFAMLTLLVMGLEISVALATEFLADEERELTALVNAERIERGIEELPTSDPLRTVARRHTQKMVAEGRIFHSDTLAEDVEELFDDWTGAGENVGRGPDIPVTHQAFMDSPGHRDNLLGSQWDIIAIGVMAGSDSLFMTEQFVGLAGGAPGSEPQPATTASPTPASGAAASTPAPASEPTRAPTTSTPAPRPASTTPARQPRSIDDYCATSAESFEATFDDTLESVHWLAIECVHDRGLVRGVEQGRFAPTLAVTRGQVASLLARASTVQADPSFDNTFVDDDGTIHEDSIEQLVTLGVIDATTDRLIRPGDGIERATMARWTARWMQIHGVSASSPLDDAFDDDNQRAEQSQINLLSAKEVAVGDGRRSFFPSSTLSRAQMTSLLARALAVIDDEAIQ